MDRRNVVRWFACLMVAIAGLGMVWFGPSSAPPAPAAAHDVVAGPGAVKTAASSN